MRSGAARVNPHAEVFSSPVDLQLDARPRDRAPAPAPHATPTPAPAPGPGRQSVHELSTGVKVGGNGKEGRKEVE